MLQKGLNVKLKNIWRKTWFYFEQELFYYIVHIFFIWLHKADLLWLLLLKWAMCHHFFGIFWVCLVVWFFFLPLTKFLYTLHLECEDSLHLLNTPPDCNDQSDDLLYIVYDKLYNAVINITLFIIFHKIKIIKCLKIHNIKRPRLTHMIQIVLKGGP